MVLHGPVGTSRVPGAQGGHDPQVFGVGRPEVVADVAVGIAEDEANVDPEHSQIAAQNPVSGGLGNRPVQEIVGLGVDLVAAVGQGGRSLVNNLLEAAQEPLIHAVCGQLGGETLQGGPDRKRIEHVLWGEVNNLEPAVCTGDNQALLNEAGEGLPNRGGARAEFGGEPVEDDALAGDKPTADQILTDGFVNLLNQGGAAPNPRADRGHCSVLYDIGCLGLL